MTKVYSRWEYAINKRSISLCKKSTIHKNMQLIENPKAYAIRLTFNKNMQSIENPQAHAKCQQSIKIYN